MHYIYTHWICILQTADDIYGVYCCIYAVHLFSSSGEARVAELAHAFPADALASIWPDVTLKEMDFPWFLNEWQALDSDQWSGFEHPKFQCKNGLDEKGVVLSTVQVDAFGSGSPFARVLQ